MRSLMTPIRGGVIAAVMLGTTALPAAAHPQPPAPTLEVSNPSDGDLITPGRMVIQGIAFDDSAETGVGIDRVSLFIGDRDEENGAIFLGDARLGLPNPQKVPKEECEPETRSLVLCPAGTEKGDHQFDLAGWNLTTPVLKATGQASSLYVYARSSVSGVEAVEIIPITMGEGGGDEGGSEE
jgi:hypothetical protein